VVGSKVQGCRAQGAGCKMFKAKGGHQGTGRVHGGVGASHLVAAAR
jgi:hypothetical protein